MSKGEEEEGEKRGEEKRGSYIKDMLETRSRARTLMMVYDSGGEICNEWRKAVAKGTESEGKSKRLGRPSGV